ncbi:MAG: LPS export ABC transporter permease LptF [Desulfobacteraceae bacterium]
MRSNIIINRYMIREFLPPFGINLFFFMFIFLITKILEITNLVVNYQVSLFSFLLLLAYSMPFFLAFITPMSVMMAVLLVFLRMSGDHEIVALKACGLNPNRFLVPVLLFCFMGWLMTTFITMVGLPWGNRSYYGLSVDLAQTHADAVIKERTFIDSFQGLTLYVNQVDMQNQSIKDVFIEDQRNKNVNNIIVAPRGRITSDPLNFVIRLKLFDGAINQVDLARQTANVVSFETYEMKMDLQEMVSKGISKRKPIEEMTLFELKDYLRSSHRQDKKHYKALMKFHEKFALPFACFALGMVAIPLGMQSTRSNRSMGTVMGILLFLTYYILLTVAWSFGESGTVPPVVGIWTPNIVMGGIGIYLYIRMVKERPVRLKLSPNNILQRFRKHKR